MKEKHNWIGLISIFLSQRLHKSYEGTVPYTLKWSNFIDKKSLTDIAVYGL